MAASPTAPASPGSRVAITAKLNMADGARGLHPDDSVEVAGEAPVREFAAAFPPPLRWGLRVGGRAFLREYPYQEAYLLEHARRFRRELKLPLILLGGISQRETIDAAIGEGFAFVAMARALPREPACPPSTAAPTAYSVERT